MLQVKQGGLTFKNTSNLNDPVIDVQSDSEFICNYCNITDHRG